MKRIHGVSAPFCWATSSATARSWVRTTSARRAPSTSCRAPSATSSPTPKGDADPFAGDAIFATFDSVVAAVEAALAIQRRVAEEEFAGTRLQMRIGVHFGDVLVREGAPALRRRDQHRGAAANAGQTGHHLHLRRRLPPGAQPLRREVHRPRAATAQEHLGSGARLSDRAARSGARHSACANGVWRLAVGRIRRRRSCSWSRRR